MPGKKGWRKPLLWELDEEKLAAWETIFWGRAEKKGGGCIEWTLTRNNRNYGVVGVNSTTLLAHRVAWFLTHGEFPEPKEVVMHTCDNPPCVNPLHLALGTHSENTLDAVKKGRRDHIRRRRGEQVHSAKVADSDVLVIMGLLRGGFGYQEIAVIYGIDYTLAWQFEAGKVRKHLFYRAGEVMTDGRVYRPTNPIAT